MTDISDGVRQYTSNTPRDLNIFEVIKRKVFNYKIVLSHGKRISDEIKGEASSNQEYGKLIH